MTVITRKLVLANETVRTLTPKEFAPTGYRVGDTFPVICPVTAGNRVGRHASVHRSHTQAPLSLSVVFSA